MILHEYNMWARAHTDTHTHTHTHTHTRTHTNTMYQSVYTHTHIHTHTHTHTHTYTHTHIHTHTHTHTHTHMCTCISLIPPCKHTHKYVDKYVTCSHEMIVKSRYAVPSISLKTVVGGSIWVKLRFLHCSCSAEILLLSVLCSHNSDCKTTTPVHCTHVKFVSHRAFGLYLWVHVPFLTFIHWNTRSTCMVLI